MMVGPMNTLSRRTSQRLKTPTHMLPSMTHDPKGSPITGKHQRHVQQDPPTAVTVESVPWYHAAAGGMP